MKIIMSEEKHTVAGSYGRLAISDKTGRLQGGMAVDEDQIFQKK